MTIAEAEHLIWKIMNQIARGHIDARLGLGAIMHATMAALGEPLRGAAWRTRAGRIDRLGGRHDDAL